MTATDGEPEGGTEILLPSEMIPATVVVPVSEEKQKTEVPVRRKTSFYYMIGLVILVVVIALVYIIGRRGEDRPVDIPAIKEMVLSGQVAGKEVQMALTQIGDSLYGSYSYKHINNPIQLMGRR